MSIKAIRYYDRYTNLAEQLERELWPTAATQT